MRLGLARGDAAAVQRDAFVTREREPGERGARGLAHLCLGLGGRR